MNIMLIDDDDAVRMMLQDIIEDYELGTIVQSLDSAVSLDNSLLSQNQIDILIIDMLMPGIDGITAISKIRTGFNGKIIMLSQVESKELVGKAYADGVDSYITKPLNRNEIVSVIRNTIEHLKLAAFAQNLQNSLSHLTPMAKPVSPQEKSGLKKRGETILKDLGIANAPGASDLLAILDWLENNKPSSLPSLKTLFTAVAESRQENSDSSKEAKAMEQRLRRTIYQGHINLATTGAVDYTNPKFEEYAPLFFDYTDIRNTMRLIEAEQKPTMSHIHINIKKFITALFDMANR